MLLGCLLLECLLTFGAQNVSSFPTLFGVPTGFEVSLSLILRQSPFLDWISTQEVWRWYYIVASKRYTACWLETVSSLHLCFPCLHYDVSHVKKTWSKLPCDLCEVRTLETFPIFFSVKFTFWPAGFQTSSCFSSGVLWRLTTCTNLFWIPFWRMGRSYFLWYLFTKTL